MDSTFLGWELLITDIIHRLFSVVRMVLLIECRSDIYFPVDVAGRVIVVMGVSGAGKSTVGKLLSKEINCTFIDADDFHSESNKDKMKEGIPLSDEDRAPWLSSLCNTLQEHMISGESLVLACSALKKEYREVLRLADPNYRSGNRACMVEFVLLNVSAEVLADRLTKRAADGGHFMPADLLQSQLDLLEIDDAEGVQKIDGMLAPQAILSTIQEAIMGRRYGRAI